MFLFGGRVTVLKAMRDIIICLNIFLIDLDINAKKIYWCIYRYVTRIAKKHIMKFKTLYTFENIWHKKYVQLLGFLLLFVIPGFVVDLSQEMDKTSQTFTCLIALSFFHAIIFLFTNIGEKKEKQHI